ncbi:MAG TPA: amino acid ABC transporter permease [Actinomycetota bacterium]
MDRPRDPDDVTAFRAQEGAAVEVAPHKEPTTRREWIKENLFSTPFSGILTVLSAAFILYFGYGFLHWIFVGGEWQIVKGSLRSYMIGRFPFEEAWRVWVGFFLVAALGGLSWGVLEKRIAWSLRRIISTALVAVAGVGLLFYLIESGRVWVLLGSLIATYFGMMWFGKVVGRRLEKVVALGWLLIYPAVVLILVGFGGPSPRRWDGLLLNVMVGSIGIVASFPIGLLLALGRRSSFPAIRTFCVGFIELIRGVPLVTLIISAIFLLPLLLPPQWELNLVIRLTIVFTIFSAAYVAEIVRGGLQGVHQGQYEAAKALGLPTWRMTAFVILPQALRNTIPAMISHFISVWKDTSLLSASQANDLLDAARRSAASLDFIGHSKEAYFAAGLIFWVVAISLGRWSQRVEKRVGVGER